MDYTKQKSTKSLDNPQLPKKNIGFDNMSSKDKHSLLH